MGNQDNQDRQQPSADSRAIDLINKAQSARKNYGGVKTATNAAKAARAGTMMAQGAGLIGEGGGTAAAGGVTTGAAPLWGTGAAIAAAVVIFVIILFVIVFGGGNNPPTCGSITADSTTANNLNPVVITLEDCVDNVVFSWSSSANGGAFDPTDGQSTKYTPPSLPTNTVVTVTASICATGSTTQCTQNTIDITITTPTCQDKGGACTTAAICNFGGGKTVSGTTNCPSVCCDFKEPASFHFYCQYDRSYSNCHVIYSNNTCSNNGCSAANDRCDIISNGCTPSSVAMVLASLGKTQWNPRNTALRVYDLTGAASGCTCGGSPATTFFPFIGSQGLRVYSGSGENLADNLNFRVERAKQRLAQGCYLLAAADMRYNRSLSGRGGHATLITAIRDSDNRITVMDPTWCSSDTSYTTRYLYPNGLDSSGRRVLYDWWSVYAICP